MPQGSDQIGPLKGIDEDVRFDWAAAEECVAAFRSSADLIDGQKGTRSSAVSTATGEFRGYYADLFKQNAGIQEQDATNVATALRDAATKIERLAEEARKEQQRRETGRRWKEEHDNRNWFDKTWDAIFGEDPPGIGPAAEPIVETSPAPATGARQDLTGQGPTGTSSARPGDLRSFASTSTDLNSALSDSSSAAKSRYDAFVAGCGWGSVDASGVLTGFTTYIAANENDVHWANVVADLFEAAGSNGDVTTLSNSTIDEGLRNAGVNAVRSPTAVQPANVAGGQTTSGYADDPVNAGSGSFVEPEVDFAGAGGLAALIFTRVYNSRGGAPSGAFGPGWSSAADSRVFFTDEAGVWIREDGAHINFPRDGQGWGRAPGHTLWLEADPGGSGYIISDHQGGRWYFDAAGLLISTSRGAGTRVDFERSNGRLVRLLHERGPALVCEWEGERIVALTTWDGRRTEYFYDEAGRLIGVAGGDHGGRSYQWNSAGVVCAVSDADGVRFVENTYDEDGRVLTQRSARGALTEYTYLPGHITQVASEDGTNVWRHDDRGRLIAVTDGNGGRQNAGWDRWDGQVIFTGRDGVTTAREFDARGRLVTEGRDKVITRIEWDEQDRATRVTVTSDDTTYETLYEYEGEGRFPSRITDPEGGVTQAQWDKNLLLKIIDPTGRVTRFEYDAHGDVIGVINGVGGHARLERDEAGRITRSISPEGRVTRFEYSSAGHCVRITDPAGGVWTREYSAAGRLIAKTDPLGGRTEILVDQAGDEVGTIDELGRPFRMELDSAGMVSNVELPDGTTWEFTHDALSRLTQMRDGSGGTWDLEFDKAGHPLVGTDPTGVPTIATVGTAGFTDSITALGATYSSERDRLGRLISETGPDGASSHYEYDRCGRLVCAVDPDGGVTRYERDAAGRPVWVTLPSGLRYGYEYDAAGRWTGAVSTGGNRWSFAYDGDGNLVEEAWPTGEKVVTEYDGAGRPVRRYQPGEGTTTVAYDACGRVVRVRDPYWGVRKYTYTAAGQIETITNALGGVTRIEYDVNARPYKMIDPAGGVSLREFDGAGRTISVTDPAGMSTRITYDAAGRPIRQVHAVGESAWTYDKFGRLATETRDGMTRTWEHDPAAATTTVTATDEGGSSVTQWWWDWAGRTTRARSGTLETRWSYTPDGRLEAIVRPDGEVTRFEYDAEGALASLSRDGMGELAVERDMLGRVVSAHGDGVHMTWTWESGHLARFTSARGGDQTVVDYDRDEQGRILRRTTNGVVESFSYDEAGQLTSWSGPHGREEWSWDAMGRLRTHTNTDAGLGEVSTSYSYDTGGRLLATVTNSVAGSGASGRGVRVEYAYDEAGRRTSERTGDSWRRYSWNGSALASVTDLAKSGDSWQATAHWDLGWDTTGALATINGTPVDWQGTSPSQMGAVSVETLPGLLTMTATPNTDSLDGPTLDEAARATGLADTGLAETVAIGAAHTGGLPAGVSPWDTPPILATTPLATAPNSEGSALPPPPDGAGVTARGSIAFGGLEVMGVRVYDQNTQQFLSRDPLASPAEAPWGHNPYSYAANNPLTFSDPTGRSPVTDEQLQAYKDAHSGALSQAWNWAKDNWQYIAAGAVIVAGVVMCATGVGAPIGAAMLTGAAMSGVFSAGTQYVTTGTIDPKKLAFDTFIGGATGPIGGGVTGPVASKAASWGLCKAGQNILSGAASGFVEGAASGGLEYMLSPGEKNLAGFAQATGSEALFGGLTGGAGDAVANKMKGLSGWACFAPGTPVVMADGSTRPIEEVQVGDLVLAHNPHTGCDEAREVTATHTHEDTATWLITTTDGGTITTTPTHRFWVEGKGWTAAQDLHEGDQIGATVGSAAAVVATSTTTGQTSTVHNLTTNGLHNYYTLTDNGSTLLVHNTYTQAEVDATLGNVTSSGTTVLGPFPSYIEKAEKLGASYFDIGSQWDNVVARGEDPWGLNRMFLDDRIAAGDRIIMSKSKQELEATLKPGSYTARELEYLHQQGYRWVNQWALYPPSS